MPREGETMNEARQIAEALGPDRDRRARQARERADRRERIATAIIGGAFRDPDVADYDLSAMAETVVAAADALMAELDRRRDAELQEARQ